jgi:hypothetical protein
MKVKEPNPFIYANMQRREFKNAKVYKRQPFQYFNDLGAIVGNDIAEGNAATTALETEEGNPMEEPFNVNDEDDISFSIHLDSAADLDEDPYPSNQSTATPSARGTPTPSVTRVGKRRKASMAASLDAMCETMKKIKEGMSNVHLHKIDQSDHDNALTGAYTALKSIPELSRGVFLRVYDTFVVERERAKGFLLMTEDERVDWIAATYGGL